MPATAKRNFSPDTIRAIRGSKEPRKVIADRYGLNVRTVNQIRAGETYKHVVGGWPEPDEPTRPSSHELLRLQVQEGWTAREIMDRFGLSRSCVHSALKRARKRYTIDQNTSPSDARPLRSESAHPPLDSNSIYERVHSGGDVPQSAGAPPHPADGRASLRSANSAPAGVSPPAGAFSQVKSGKAWGGRKSMQAKRSYYHAFGGKQSDHDRARANARAHSGETCAACQSAPAEDDGLCGGCAGLVQRVQPGAAYGGVPGTLNQRASGTEADNIVCAEDA